MRRRAVVSLFTCVEPFIASEIRFVGTVQNIILITLKKVFFILKSISFILFKLPNLFINIRFRKWWI